MNIEDFSPELQEKLKAAKSSEELVAIATEEGIDLTDEQLDAVAGGVDWGNRCDNKNCMTYSDYPENDCWEY